MCYEKQSFSASDNEGVLIGILCLRCQVKELTDWLCHNVKDHDYHDSLGPYLKEHPMLAHKSRLKPAIGQGRGSPTGTNLQS